MGTFALLAQIQTVGHVASSLADLIVPLVAIAIPIVAIMLSHQRKMAQMYLERQTAQPSAEIQSLRQEIRELKALVHEQTIALDNALRPTPDTIRERVGA